MSSSRTRTATFGVTFAAGLAFVAAQWPVAAAQGQPPAQTSASGAAARPACGAHGVVQSGDQPLAGASVTAKAGDRTVAVTSTDLDGTYFVPLTAGTYTIHVELTAFTASDHDVTVSEAACTPTVDLKLALGPRTMPPAAATAAAPATSTTPTPASNAPAATTTAQAQGPARGANAPGPAAGANQPQGRGGAGGRGGFQNAPRFQSLAVQQSANAPAASADTTADLSTAIQDDPASRLLPAGFSLDAPQESVAVNGTTIQIDRGQLADRMAALANGDFGLADGTFGQPGQAVAGGFGGGDLGGGGGGGGGRGGGGGFGGPGGIGGRLGGANRVQINANYQFGGSALDSKPYPLNGVQQAKPSYVQQTASTTIGGPLKIPGIYDGSRRTTFNFSFTGSRDGNLFDQYATVPSDAWRSGDFSSSATPIIDPTTGQPFPGNVIPDQRISAAAKELLQYVPHALDNLPTSTRNFENTGTTHSKTNQFSLRITHSITAPPQQGRGGRGGFAGGAAGGGRGGAAAGAQGAARGGAAGPNGQNGQNGRGNVRPPQLNITLNATVNYRSNQNDRFNVFPALDGSTKGSTISVPVTVNMRYGRSMHNFTFNYNRTKSVSTNPFQFNTNVAGLAGITGVSTNPFDWGVPSISFGSNLTGISGSSPSSRVNDSWQVGYTWTRPAGKHNWRIGADFQQQNNFLQSDPNAAGSFIFSGLYTANGQHVTTGSGQDFADFLLGMPQQASLQCALSACGSTGALPNIQIQGRVFDAFVQDDFRWKPRWTISYGVRYEYTGPFTETHGNMVNLDINNPLTQVAQVFPNGVGPFSGAYPSSLVNPDWNNVAPRVGVAWRATNKAVIRFGYGLTYNNGTYSNIARNLYQQPPFFDTETVTGSLGTPLSVDNALALASVSSITNNYAISKNYQLGLIHQWNVDYSRDLFKTWAIGSTYVGTLGRSLDMLTAPNQGATGEILASVQPFEYQNSNGRSYSNSVSFRLQKRQSHGVSGTIQYTLASSRDDTTATSGGTSLAQDSQNIAAEWAPSNFNRRHQFTATSTIQLPWGVDRHWLASGGPLSSIVGDWTLSANLTWQSGTPLTARCSACAADLARGTVGTLRADYLGGSTALASPIIGPNGQITFFNVGAFAVPAPGTFGDSERNMIVGPGSHQLNATFSRDVRLGGSRGMTINVSVNNILNTVNYGSIDTNVNSPTFGQVTSVRALRSARVNIRFRF